MNTITIQNVKIPMKEWDCLRNQEKTLRSLVPYVNINVYITNECNGSCRFCCNINNDSFLFDFEKFKLFIDEVVSKVQIKKITFTGGEPSLDLDNLCKCIEYIKSKCDSATNITICTNGNLLRFSSFKTPWESETAKKIIEIVDNISVSRHHWHNLTNNEIIGIDFPSFLFKQFPLISKVNLSCNLIRGHIDSEFEMRNMLDYASVNGIENVSFVKLMPINKFCEENKIEINSLQNKKDMLEYDKWKFPKENICECKNYVYRAKNNRLIKFYIRNNQCHTFNMGSYIIYKRNSIQNWY